VTLEHDALCENLSACQRKCIGLKQEVIYQQKALEEAFIRAIKVEKESLNFMEDIECYNQSLIDMKEQLMEKMLRCF
jgi:hypothetical protein